MLVRREETSNPHLASERISTDANKYVTLCHIAHEFQFFIINKSNCRCDKHLKTNIMIKNVSEVVLNFSNKIYLAEVFRITFLFSLMYYHVSALGVGEYMIMTILVGENTF